MGAPVGQVVSEPKFDLNQFIDDAGKFVQKSCSRLAILSPTGLGNAMKTRNFAATIFCAGFLGAVAYVAYAFIPAYLFIGVFIATAVHMRGGNFKREMFGLWNDKKRLECIITVASIGLAAYTYPKMALCAFAASLIWDPKSILC